MATVWRTGMRLTSARLTADGGSWPTGRVVTAALRRSTTGTTAVTAGDRLTPAELNA